MKQSEIIREMTELLATSDKWIQRELAKDCLGNNVRSNNPEAVQFCLNGALGHVCSIGSESVWYLMRSIAQYKGYQDVISFNDDPNTTHEDVMQFLKEALYQAEMEEIA